MRTTTSSRAVRHFTTRALFVLVLVVVATFFTLPLVWLLTAPFSEAPTMSVEWPEWTLDNFRALADNP